MWELEAHASAVDAGFLRLRLVALRGVAPRIGRDLVLWRAHWLAPAVETAIFEAGPFKL